MFRFVGDVTPKEFEQKCFDVIKGIVGVGDLPEQGSCAKTESGAQYCPDTYGTYKVPSQQIEIGFVIDFKRYSPGRSINKADCDKLDRDCEEVEKKLKKEKKIKKDAEVRGMFVISEGKEGTAKKRNIPVIRVDNLGAPHWKIHLRADFEKAMQ